MTLGSLVRVVPWGDVERSLLQYYPDARESVEGYRRVFFALRDLTPVPSAMRLSIHTTSPPELDEQPFPEVVGRNGTLNRDQEDFQRLGQAHDSDYALAETEFALELHRWDEWLGSRRPPELTSLDPEELQLEDQRRAGRDQTARAAVAVAILAFCAGCAAASQVPTVGTVAGQSLRTTVDSDVASFYLEHHLRADRSDSALARLIDTTLREAKPDPYDRETLKRLSERLSTDFAAIYFASALYQRPANKRAQDAFHAAVRRLTDPGGDPTPRKGHGAYLVAFVPGYGYKKDPTTGADFARPREILRTRGFRTTLIETDESGTVEENADIVADAVRQLAGREAKVILVSASKGGPEVALALGDRLAPEDSASVKAWISVGGLIKGSPYADHVLQWPRRWLAEIILRIQGGRPGIIRNLSTTVRRPVFDGLRIPRYILTLQYIGVPLSGHIGKSVRRRYEALRPLGPNDGSTLLADELVPGGVVVTDIGLDHYYRDPIIELKTIALAYVVLAELEQREKDGRAR